jgi:hypothetical protein
MDQTSMDLEYPLELSMTSETVCKMKAFFIYLELYTTGLLRIRLESLFDHVWGH